MSLKVKFFVLILAATILPTLVVGLVPLSLLGSLLHNAGVSDALGSAITDEMRDSILAYALFLAVSLSFFSFLLYRVFGEPVADLIEGMRRIRERRFNERLPVTTGGEIGELAESFNQMAEQIQMYVKRLEGAMEKLSAEDQAKTEFLAILAHELRNPLAPVVSSLELLKLEAQKDERQESLRLLGIAEAHVRTITHLLDDLLDITRISKKKFKLQKDTIELQSLVNHAVETIDAFYKSRNHTLTVSAPKEILWVQADSLRLQQIIVNILYNAAKYTNPGGEVALRIAYESGRGVRIEVQDNGVGIDKTMLKRIFEPFTQVHPDRGIGTGLGIGLSLTKRLVELHGGKIWAESEGLSKGSTFIVDLPIVESAQLPIPIPQASTEETMAREIDHALEGRSILIVDDNEAAARGLGKLLEHYGYRVDMVYDGKTAIDRMRESRSGVVLLDIGLPGMDGYAVARELRKMNDGNQIVLIALTGFGQAEDKMKAKQAGFNHHLTKPVGIAEVESALRLYDAAVA
jgi:signal transduction histidine kinase/CheY-like chemotaxis protein